MEKKDSDFWINILNKESDGEESLVDPCLTIWVSKKEHEKYISLG